MPAFCPDVIPPFGCELFEAALAATDVAELLAEVVEDETVEDVEVDWIIVGWVSVLELDAPVVEVDRFGASVTLLSEAVCEADTAVFIAGSSELMAVEKPTVLTTTVFVFTVIVDTPMLVYGMRLVWSPRAEVIVVALLRIVVTIVVTTFCATEVLTPVEVNVARDSDVVGIVTVVTIEDASTAIALEHRPSREGNHNKSRDMATVYT